MGFLNDASSGYKKLKNKDGLTNEYFYRKLCEAGLSFGKPELGSIRVLGREDEAVVFHLGRYDVYLKADNKKIEIAKIYAQNVKKAGNLMKELTVATVTDAQGLDTAQADRAVDELFDVTEQIMETGSGKSRVLQAAPGENGGSSVLYMDQKIFSIRDKYKIYTEDQVPVYQVKGNLTGLGFDISKENGENVYTIKKKMVAITPEYTILKGKEKIGNIKKKIKLTRAEISGEIGAEKLTIRGDMSGFHFSVELDGQVVGSVDTRRLTWGDCYAIESRDPAREDLMVAVAVICDNSLKGKD